MLCRQIIVGGMVLFLLSLGGGGVGDEYTNKNQGAKVPTSHQLTL